MPNQVGTSQVIRFATFEVDFQAQELRKGGLRLKLGGQPFQVLAILLEHPEEWLGATYLCAAHRRSGHRILRRNLCKGFGGDRLQKKTQRL
jgi:DNA-binding response OmpR family regulator